jgi:tRNA(adenine34) deaminase
MQITDEYFMRFALTEAEQAYEEDEIPIGAVVVLQNKIIGKGHNQTEKLQDATAHAEMLALTAAFNFLGTKYLPDASLYVTVEPCLMCCGALYWSKISKVIYGADDEKNGFKKFIQQGKENLFLHPKTILTKGILKEECTQLMKDFFKQKR